MRTDPTAPFALLGPALAALALAPRPAAAQTAAIGPISGALGVEDNAADTGSAGYSLGFQFTLSAPVTVTALGYFTDRSFDPAAPFNSVTLSPPPSGDHAFQDTHPVGIYTSLGTLILSGIVPQTGGATLGDFVYTGALTGDPVLAAGTYTLAGLSGADDPYVYDVQDSTGALSGLATAPGVTYVRDEFAAATALTDPTTEDPDSEPGFFGPNFQFQPTATAVPEPSPAALLTLGLGGLLLCARRKSRNPTWPGLP